MYSLFYALQNQEQNKANKSTTKTHKKNTDENQEKRRKIKVTEKQRKKIEEKSTTLKIMKNMADIF